nr:sugar phosphate isomerase/epimerase family protein [uncultured Holophaga sp.]
MFKLCFNSTTLRDIELLQALREIKKAGYEGVELTMIGSHMHPFQVSDARIREVRDFCRDIGLTLACVAVGGPTLLGDVAYEPSLICSDAAGRQLRRDLIKRSIEVTHLLEAPVLNFNSGILREDVTPAEAGERLRESIRGFLQEVGDLILVMEPEPGFFVGTTDTAIPVLRDIDSPKLRLNLDIGHVFCCEDDPYGAVERALPYSRHIHIEDIKGGIHHHEIPGEGDIDFDRIIRAIQASGYDHYVSVELHHHDKMWQRALDESRSYLCQRM